MRDRSDAELAQRVGEFGEPGEARVPRGWVNTWSLVGAWAQPWSRLTSDVVSET